MRGFWAGWLLLLGLVTGIQISTPYIDLPTDHYDDIDSEVLPDGSVWRVQWADARTERVRLFADVVTPSLSANSLQDTPRLRFTWKLMSDLPQVTAFNWDYENLFMSGRGPAPGIETRNGGGRGSYEFSGEEGRQQWRAEMGYRLRYAWSDGTLAPISFKLWLLDTSALAAPSCPRLILEECPICFEYQEQGGSTLWSQCQTCSKQFHLSCISRWSGSCPHCRSTEGMERFIAAPESSADSNDVDGGIERRVTSHNRAILT